MIRLVTTVGSQEFTFFCETPEEAVTLTKLMASKNGRQPTGAATATPARESQARGDTPTVAAVVRQLNVRQKALLTQLARHGTMTDASLREALNIGTASLGGLLAGIGKAATRLDSPSPLYSKVTSNDGSVSYRIPPHSLEGVRDGVGG